MAFNHKNPVTRIFRKVKLCRAIAIIAISVTAGCAVNPEKKVSILKPVYFDNKELHVVSGKFNLRNDAYTVFSFLAAHTGDVNTGINNPIFYNTDDKARDNTEYASAVAGSLLSYGIVSFELAKGAELAYKVKSEIDFDSIAAQQLEAAIKSVASPKIVVQHKNSGGFNFNELHHDPLAITEGLNISDKNEAVIVHYSFFRPLVYDRSGSQIIKANLFLQLIDAKSLTVVAAGAQTVEQHIPKNESELLNGFSDTDKYMFYARVFDEVINKMSHSIIANLEQSNSNNDETTSALK